MTPDSAIGTNANLSALKDQANRILAVHHVLVSRNIKSRYQETVLGLAWTLIGPLIMAGVLIFVVQHMMENRSSRFSTYVYSGVLVFGWFRGALSQATRSVVNNRMLARRPGFPPEVLPLVPVTNNLIDFLLSTPVLAVILVIGGSTFSSSFLLLPVLVVCQYLITAGLAYLFATGHMLFRDTGHVVELLLTLGFFLTPIFYEITQTPEQYRWIFWLNPLVPLLEAYRSILIHGEWPQTSVLITICVTAIVAIFAGARIFRATAPKYVEAI
jgi:lipopolysaccharide transport system permease protein